MRRLLKGLGNKEIGGKHRSVGDLRRDLGVDLTGYYGFAFVRNPWDRTLSLFHYYKSGRHPDRIPATVSFEDWVVSAFDPEESALPGSFKNTMRYQDELWDQCSYLTEGVNRVGRVETLEQDFRGICDEIGVTERVFPKGIVRLPRANATQHEHYRAVYSDRARELVESHYARDVERFGYSF